MPRETYRQAQRSNAPALTCRNCYGPMAYHKTGLCTKCDQPAMVKVKKEDLCQVQNSK